jgi:hypothetical protein
LRFTVEIDSIVVQICLSCKLAGVDAHLSWLQKHLLHFVLSARVLQEKVKILAKSSELQHNNSSAQMSFMLVFLQGNHRHSAKFALVLRATIQLWMRDSSRNGVLLARLELWERMEIIVDIQQHV